MSIDSYKEEVIIYIYIINNHIYDITTKTKMRYSSGKKKKKSNENGKSLLQNAVEVVEFFLSEDSRQLSEPHRVSCVHCKYSDEATPPACNEEVLNEHLFAVARLRVACDHHRASRLTKDNKHQLSEGTFNYLTIHYSLQSLTTSLLRLFAIIECLKNINVKIEYYCYNSF